MNSYIFVNGVETYKFRAKDSEMNAAPLCLGTGSEKYSVDNTKKTQLCRYFYEFSIDYDNIDVADILDIYNI